MYVSGSETRYSFIWSVFFILNTNWSETWLPSPTLALQLWHQSRVPLSIRIPPVGQFFATPAFRPPPNFHWTTVQHTCYWHFFVLYSTVSTYSIFIITNPWSFCYPGFHLLLTNAFLRFTSRLRGFAYEKRRCLESHASNVLSKTFYTLFTSLT